MVPRVKICCIKNKEEADLAINYGAAAVGLVGPMPSGPGVISNEMIHSIAKTVPPPIATFLLTSETTTEGIRSHHEKVRTNTIQMVDAVEAGTYDDLQVAVPGTKIVQVIHVIDESSLEEALSVADGVDALLLDSGNPNLAVKELGGTGRVHNWAISRRIVDEAPVPVFLAGGLKPENVKKALDEVGPYGLDLCSGVRTDGKLDEAKLDAFFRELG